MAVVATQLGLWDTKICLPSIGGQKRLQGLCHGHGQGIQFLFSFHQVCLLCQFHFECGLGRSPTRLWIRDHPIRVSNVNRHSILFFYDRGGGTIIIRLVITVVPWPQQQQSMKQSLYRLNGPDKVGGPDLNVPTDRFGW